MDNKRFHELLNAFESVAPIMVLGDVGVDKYTYGEVARISPEAPVPVLEVTKEWCKLGLAANVLDNLRSLNVPASLCSVMGDDRNGDVLLSLMKEHGMATDHLLKIADRKTTFKERVLTNTQQICRVDYETLCDVSEAETERLLTHCQEKSAEHSGLIIEDYGKGMLTEKFCRRVISLFKEQGKAVGVDPSRKTPPQFYHGATLLKPNREESRLMAESLGYRQGRHSNPEEIANILVEKLSLEKIIITLGAEGMGLLDTKSDGRFHIIPTFAREVYDVSGAGDTAIATVMAALMAGGDLLESAWMANCASGIVVGKRGTATCNRDELKKFYREHFS